jgi:hypothetical protein
VAVPAPTSGGYVALDERDSFPNITGLFALDDETDRILTSYGAPSTPEAKLAFFARATSTFESSFAASALATTPAEFLAAYRTLPTNIAKALSLSEACYAASATDTTSDEGKAWTDAITSALGALPTSTYLSYASLGACDPLLVESVLGESLDRAAAAPDANAASLLAYSLFDFGDTRALAAFKSVYGATRTTWSRDLVATYVAAKLWGIRGFRKPTDAAQSPWREFVREMLATATSSTRLSTLARALVATRDIGALPLFGARLAASNILPRQQRALICQARLVAKDDPGAFATFASALGSLVFAPDAQAALASDAGCEPAR